jgi:hypothetical protein
MWGRLPRGHHTTDLIDTLIEMKIRRDVLKTAR